jgi:hypothetical protein
MKNSKYALFIAIMIPAIALPTTGPTPSSSNSSNVVGYKPVTLMIKNQAPFNLFVMPDMQWLPTGMKEFEGRPLSAIIGAYNPSQGQNSLGVAFTYPAGLQVGAVYLLTPKALAEYQQANPSVTTFDPEAIYNWIMATGKGANDGVHISTKPNSITVYSSPDESDFRIY